MATRLHLDPDFSAADAMEPYLEPSRRTDGWTAERQRAFCDLLATGVSVEGAARAQGLSPSSAYAFRNSAKGAAFAVGWTAAQLLQRQRLADSVAARALEGQTVTITRPDGSTVERHYHDNRLAMSVLARLDRLAAGQVAAGVPDTSGEGQAARLAAAEFDRYLDVLGQNGGPARAGLFLAARTDAAKPGAPELAALSSLARADLYSRTGAGVPAEVEVADLDPAARAGWTAEQWARAEAAGLLVLAPAPDEDTPHSQHSDAGEEDEPVWWDEELGEWRTRFPPDDDWCGEEEGLPGDLDYSRDLTDAELASIGQPPEPTGEEREVADAAARDRWFAAAAQARAEAADRAGNAGEDRERRTMTDAECAAYWGLPLPPADDAPTEDTLSDDASAEDGAGGNSAHAGAVLACDTEREHHA